MHFSPYLPKQYGPVSYLPETVFDHFSHEGYIVRDRVFFLCGDPEEISGVLETDEGFVKFWTQIQEQHPEKKDYFLSILSEDELCDTRWILEEYEEYVRLSGFEAIPEDEQRALQNGFDGYRLAQYQVTLEAESRRLNCDIADVKPMSIVLPWKPDHDEESMLAKLPDQLFGRIFPFLESLDIFNMTLVCKNWRRVICDNSMELKKAEHAMTTHFIRYTDWLDVAKTSDHDSLLCQYEKLSWGLTRWFCEISEDLETLILDHPIPYIDLTILLQSCPNLRHLRTCYDPDCDLNRNKTMLARVKLRKLEVFMAKLTLWYSEYSRVGEQLYRDIFASSPSLRVYQGPLDSPNFFAINARNPGGNAFSKLTALYLEHFTPAFIELLAQVDDLQLRYLGFGRQDYTRVDGPHDEERALRALHQLLPKLKKLEMLSTSIHLGVTNDTILLMTDLRLNISWAVLYHFYIPPESIDGEVVYPEKDPLQPEVLDAFRSMLLSKNPEIDLSEISLIIYEGKTLEALEAMNTGFTISIRDSSGYPPDPINGLHDPKIKRRLGIDF